MCFSLTNMPDSLCVVLWFTDMQAAPRPKPSDGGAVKSSPGFFQPRGRDGVEESSAPWTVREATCSQLGLWFWSCSPPGCYCTAWKTRELIKLWIKRTLELIHLLFHVLHNIMMSNQGHISECTLCMCHFLHITEMCCSTEAFRIGAKSQ